MLIRRALESCQQQHLRVSSDSAKDLNILFIYSLILTSVGFAVYLFHAHGKPSEAIYLHVNAFDWSGAFKC